jgi:hypothetical protein
LAYGTTGAGISVITAPSSDNGIRASSGARITRILRTHIAIITIHQRISLTHAIDTLITVCAGVVVITQSDDGGEDTSFAVETLIQGAGIVVFTHDILNIDTSQDRIAGIRCTCLVVIAIQQARSHAVFVAAGVPCCANITVVTRHVPLDGRK